MNSKKWLLFCLLWVSLSFFYEVLVTRPWINAALLRLQNEAAVQDTRRKEQAFRPTVFMDSGPPPTASFNRTVQPMTLWDGGKDKKRPALDGVDGSMFLATPLSNSPKKKGTRRDCAIAADWQRTFYPTCNVFHELSSIHPQDLIGTGGARHVWNVREHGHDDAVAVLKTIKPSVVLSPDGYHNQRVDAVVMERLTSSSYWMDIYGFCGLSALNEVGQAYFNDARLFNQSTLLERLSYARDIAAGLADMQSIDGSVTATVAYADLAPNNILFGKNRFAPKLSDANQGVFLGWNTRKNEACGYKRMLNCKPLHAPEECLNDVLTDKTDVYHMGGILFLLLTGRMPYTWDDPSVFTATKRMEPTKKAPPPSLPERILQSQNPIVTGMRKAMDSCYMRRKEDRPSAREIFLLLNNTVL